MHRGLRSPETPSRSLSPTPDTPGTSIPFLDIHNAARKGNLGLVSYALANNISPNVVLDGVQPLHCAAAGGWESVARVLIDKGADVNAQKASRGRRGSGQPERRKSIIKGSHGYTPLHYVASAGSTSVAELLLDAGADPSIPDKHGILPHSIAAQIGHSELEHLLQSRLPLKSQSTNAMHPTPLHLHSSHRKVSVKRSFANIFHRRNGSSTGPPVPSTFCSNDLTETPSTISPDLPIPFGRRPSLPLNDASVSHSEAPSRGGTLPISASRSPSRRTKRPRSAGTGADSTTSPSSSRRLGSKYSLLHMFKKGEESAQTAPPSQSSFTIPSPPDEVRVRPRMGSTTNPVVPSPLAQTYSHSQTPEPDGEGSSAPASPPLTPLSMTATEVDSPPPTSPQMNGDASLPSMSPQSPVRPGILRSSHARTSSNNSSRADSTEGGQSTERGSARALRFEENGVHPRDLQDPNPIDPSQSSSDVFDKEVPEYSSEYSDDEDEDGELTGSPTQEISISYPVYPTSTSSTSGASILDAPGSPPFQIRTHAEAKDELERAQRQILELDPDKIGDPNSEIADLGDVLAAYGERLAIERRFARGEKQRWKRMSAGAESHEGDRERQSGDNTGSLAEVDEDIENADRRGSRGIGLSNSEDKSRNTREMLVGSGSAILESPDALERGDPIERNPLDIEHEDIAQTMSNYQVNRKPRLQRTNGLLASSWEDVPLPDSEYSFPQPTSVFRGNDGGAIGHIYQEPIVPLHVEIQSPTVQITKTLPTPTHSPILSDDVSPLSDEAITPASGAPDSISTMSSLAASSFSRPPHRLLPSLISPASSSFSASSHAASSYPSGETSPSPSRPRNISDPVPGSSNATFDSPIAPLPMAPSYSFHTSSPDPSFARLRNISSTPKLARMGFVGDGVETASLSDKKKGFRGLIKSIKGRS